MNLTFNHTPGNWSSFCPTSSSLTTRMIQSDGEPSDKYQIIALIGPPGYARDTDKEIADARLISKSPEMLNALLQACIELQKLSDNDPDINISTMNNRFLFRHIISEATNIPIPEIKEWIKIQAKK